MEFVSSCMELETISAKNVVNLIAKNEGKSWKLKKNVKAEEKAEL